MSNKYNFDVDLGHPLIKHIVESIEPNSTILEIGPANGRLTKYLKEILNCKVYIVEIDPVAFESAIQYAEDGICSDLENSQWDERFKGISFDFAIAQDVLEHLIKPENTLNKVQTLLKETGKIIISVPNISYSGIIMGLLTNKFEYQDIGLLDNTHVSFFTDTNLLNLVKKASMTPISLKNFNHSVQKSEFAYTLGGLSTGLEQLIEDLPFSSTYQYVAICVKTSFFEKNKTILKQDIGVYLEPPATSYVYYDTGGGFSENQKVKIAFDPNRDNSISFTLPELNVKQIRWVPIYNRRILVANVKLYDGENIILPVSSNVSSKAGIVDIFTEDTAWYLFVTDNASLNPISIMFNLKIDYDFDGRKEVESSKIQTKSITKILLEDQAEHFKQEKLVMEELLLNEKNRITLQYNNLLDSSNAEISEKDNRLKELNLLYRTANEQSVMIQKESDKRLRLFENKAKENLRLNEYIEEVSTVSTDMFENYESLLQKTHHDHSEQNMIYENHIAQLTTTVQTMTNSRSWKYTKWLRYIVSNVKSNGVLFKIYQVAKKFPPFKRLIDNRRPGNVPELEPNAIPPVNQCLALQIDKNNLPDTIDITISFIIPTYNAGLEFTQLLYLLLLQKGFLNIEIVIVDSGSSDDTADMAEFLGAKVLRIKQEEFSHSFARNLGAQNAMGDYLLFMTQDALPTGDWWARRIVEPIFNNKVVAATCMEKAREDAELYYRINIWNHWDFMELKKNDRIGTLPEEDNNESFRKNAQLSDVACAIRADVFLEYRYFGDYAEDLDLGIRLLKDGYSLGFISTEQVIHSHNREAFYYLKRALVETIQLNNILPHFPMAVYNEKDIIDIIARGYQQLSTITNCLTNWTEETMSLERFRIKMNFVLNSIKNDTVHAQGSAIIEEKLYKEISVLWVNNTNAKSSGIGMAEHMAFYFNEQVLKYFADNKNVITKADILDTTTALAKNFSTLIGIFLAWHIIAYPESDMKSLITSWQKGI